MREQQEPEITPRLDRLITVDVVPHPQGIPLVRVTGDVDMATAPVLHRTVQDHLARLQRFVVDLDGVDFLSSAGLAVLVDTQAQAQEHKLAWAAVAARSTVLRPLELTGLLAMLPIYRTVPDAITAIGD